MNRKPSVLIVDDDELSRQIAADVLEDLYEIHLAANGDEALACARAQHPALILLDAVMPGVSGYEVCRQIKADFDLSGIAVMFLSHLPDLNDRLRAYEVGAEDFLQKPFSPEELRKKAAALLRQIEEKAILKDSVQDAFVTAMTAMSSASEVGVVMEFLRSSFACQTETALLDALLRSCANFGLQAAAQIRSTKGVISRSREGASSPLQASVMTTLAECGRIVDYGARAAFSYEQVTILVTDMPVHDSDRCGRLRDHLAMLAEGAAARVDSLNTVHRLAQQQQGLYALMAQMRSVLIAIGEQHESQKMASAKVMAKLIERMDDAFLYLGLTDRQESQVSEMLRNSIEDALAIHAQGLDIQAHLGALEQALQASLTVSP